MSKIASPAVPATRTCRWRRNRVRLDGICNQLGQPAPINGMAYDIAVKRHEIAKARTAIASGSAMSCSSSCKPGGNSPKWPRSIVQ
jgi:hypothetical protein